MSTTTSLDAREGMARCRPSQASCRERGFPHAKSRLNVALNASPAGTVVLSGATPPGTPASDPVRQVHVAALQRTPSFVQGRPSFPHGRFSPSEAGGAVTQTAPADAPPTGESWVHGPPSRMHSAAPATMIAGVIGGGGGDDAKARQATSGSTHAGVGLVGVQNVEPAPLHGLFGTADGTSGVPHGGMPRHPETAVVAAGRQSSPAPSHTQESHVFRHHELRSNVWHPFALGGPGARSPGPGTTAGTPAHMPTSHPATWQVPDPSRASKMQPGPLAVVPQ